MITTSICFSSGTINGGVADASFKIDQQDSISKGLENLFLPPVTGEDATVMTYKG